PLPLRCTYASSTRSILRSCFRVALSHRIMVPSCPAVASTLPSGEKANEVAPPVCPSSSCNWPVSTSQRRTISGRELLGGEKEDYRKRRGATSLPSGEKARRKTWYMFPEGERNLSPVRRPQTTTGSALAGVRPPVASTLPSGEMATAKLVTSRLNFTLPV